MLQLIQEQNLEDCLEVIHKSFLTVADEFGLTPENCATNGAFMPFSRLNEDYQKGELMYGFYEGDTILGFMQLNKVSVDTFELRKLGVLPEHRHKGIGKNMLAFAQNKVLELGGAKITIGIIEENTRLRSWYLANGFKHTGTKVFEHLPFTVGFMELPCRE